MKISNIEPILIAVPYRYGGPLGNAARWRTMDSLIVKVETDAGIAGWGEGFGLSACATTRAALVNLVTPLALGREADDIGALMGDLARRLHNCARSGPVAFALSGLDIALWDIAGKVAGQPLYRMLGGEKTERIPAYASLLRYGTAELVERNAAEAVDRGYKHVKLHEITVPEVEIARRAIGPNAKLMVDTNCPWTPDEAVAMAKRMAPFDLLWLEEPVWPPEDYRAMARVRAEGGIPVAAGENAGTLADFSELLGTAKVDYLQPSVTKIGGITEMKKIVALARSRGVKVAPHSPYFGPGLIASVHICAALPGQPPVERFYCDLEASPFGDLIDASGGYMRVPDAPGLGLVVDEAVIARYRVK
jgi:L-alanine-DL-glutamate epimerase-like enolase superfamily enzyme